MKSIRSNQDLVTILHNDHAGVSCSLVAESPITACYAPQAPLASKRFEPGGSFLWVGNRHCLNRTEVNYLIEQLQHWCVYGYLKLDHDRDGFFIGGWDLR